MSLLALLLDLFLALERGQVYGGCSRERRELIHHSSHLLTHRRASPRDIITVAETPVRARRIRLAVR